MTQAMELLRLNYPNKSFVNIDLQQEEDDAAIAQALEQNQYVTHVLLRLGQSNAISWVNLYRVLATRGNLVYFSLTDKYYLSERAPAERTRPPILHAIQRNASVRKVRFNRIRFGGGDLCSFVDTSNHVTDLSLQSCYLQEGAQGARDVAAALQRNTNIVTLKLSWMDGFLDPILEGLVSNTCVRNLFLETAGPLLEATRNSLRVLLKSTRSIQHFGLNAMFLFLGRDRTASFSAVVGDVAASKLESFDIGYFDDPRHIQILADAIPSMKIRKLAIQFDFRATRDNIDRMKQALRQAVKENFTLQSAQYSSLDHEDETLNFYLVRNTRLAAWVENPDTVPKHLWKEALLLAANAGPEMLFRLLRKIAPEVVPAVSGRKRKRDE